MGLRKVAQVIIEWRRILFHERPALFRIAGDLRNVQGMLKQGRHDRFVYYYASRSLSSPHEALLRQWGLLQGWLEEDLQR